MKKKLEAASQVILQEEEEHSAKNLFAKFFDGRKERKQWLSEQFRLEREKTQIDNVIIQFQSLIDFIPVSLDHAKELTERLQTSEERTTRLR